MLRAKIAQLEPSHGRTNVSKRFNPPPNWPKPPADWTPPADWKPDPSWPAPPPGWPLFVSDDQPADVQSNTGSIGQVPAADTRNTLADSGDLDGATDDSTIRRPWIARHKILSAGAVAVLALIIIGAINAPSSAPTAADSGALGPTSATPTGPASAPPTTSSTQQPEHASQLHALGSTDDYWDGHFTSAADSACADNGETSGIGRMRGWNLPGGALACAEDSPGSPPWGGRIVGLDVYFPKGTSDQRAITLLAPSSLLTTPSSRHTAAPMPTTRQSPAAHVVSSTTARNHSEPLSVPSTQLTPAV